MDRESARTYLGALLDASFDLTLVRQFGENHVEFLYLQIARVLETDPWLRAVALEDIERSLLLQQTIRAEVAHRPEGFVPSELVWFLAHRTRWPEFRALADRLSGSPRDVWASNPVRRSSTTLRDALSDTWEDAEFYASFSGRQAWPH